MMMILKKIEANYIVFCFKFIVSTIWCIKNCANINILGALFP